MRKLPAELTCHCFGAGKREHDSCCCFAPRKRFAITPGMKLEQEAWLTIGKAGVVRAWFREVATKGRQ